MTALPGVARPFKGILLVLWALLILWLSLDPSPPVPENELFGWDKLQHAAAYALMTFLAGSAFYAFSGNFYRSWLAAAGISIVYGGLIELLQGWCTEARSAEFGDLVADTIGAVVVLAVVAALRYFRVAR